MARRGLCSLSIVLLASFAGVDTVWAQAEVSFLARRDFRVGESPFSVARGDFNGDGHQDLATANAGARTVSILLGRGDGTFEAAPDVGVGGSVSVTVGDFNGDGHPDLATANAGDLFELGTVSILLNDTAGGVVNDLVTFNPIPSTFTFTPDPSGCPPDFVGIFRFETRLTNIGEPHLSDLVVAVTTLTDGNLLQNADGSPGGIGARLTVPRQEGFTDGRLTPDEFVEVPFLICVTEQQPFRFVVDVLGETEQRPCRALDDGLLRWRREGA
jgi:hypothetical protein